MPDSADLALADPVPAVPVQLASIIDDVLADPSAGPYDTYVARAYGRAVATGQTEPAGQFRPYLEDGLIAEPLLGQAAVRLPAPQRQMVSTGVVQAIAQYLDDVLQGQRIPGVSRTEVVKHRPPDPAVLMYRGEFTHAGVDLQLSGAGIDFAFRRSYRNQAAYDGPLGANWDHSYNIRLTEVDQTRLVMTTGTLGEETYTLQSHHAYFVPPPGVDAVFEASGDSFVRRSPDGSRYVFARVPGTRYHDLQRIEDRYGNRLVFVHGADEHRLLLRVEVNHPDRFVVFKYDDLGRICAITDFTASTDQEGRTWRYCYDDLNDLVAVTSPATARHPAGLTTRFEYRGAFVGGPLQHNLTRIIDAAGRMYMENDFGESLGTLEYNRVVRQRQGSGESYLDYEAVAPISEGPYSEPELPSLQVVHTKRNGHRVCHVYNTAGNLLYDEECVLRRGLPRLLQTRYRYNRDGRLTDVLSPEGVLTQYLYGRDWFLRRLGITDDEADSHPALTRAERQSFGRVLASVRRAQTFGLLQLTSAARPWGSFPSVIDTIPDPADIIVKTTYEPEFGQVTTVSHPEFTNSPLPDDVNEHPRHIETLTRYEHSGPQALLSRIVQPVPTDADGGPGPQTVTQLTNYDPRGRLRELIDAEGTVSRFTYFPPADGADATREGHLQVVEIDPDDLSITIRYEVDVLGRVTAVHLPRATGDDRFIERTTYNELDQVVETVESAPFLYTTRFFYDKTGNLQRRERDLVDSNGDREHGGVEVATFCYDAEFNLTRETVGGVDLDAHHVTTHRYGPSGERLLTIGPTGNRTRFRYDEQLQAVAVIEGAGSAEASTTETEYDGDGRMIGTVDGRGNATAYRLDAFGRVVAVEDPLGNVTRTTYDKSGNTLVRRTFESRADGYNLLARSQTVYDELGRPIRRGASLFEDPPGPVPEAELATAFRDPPGPGRLLVTQLFYDAGGRLVRTVDPLDRATTTVYDPLGRPVSSVDPAGNLSEHRYDAHGNILRSDQTEVTIDQQNGAVVERRFFASAFSYDELDRRTASTDRLGNSAQYRYNSQGNQVARIDPLGNTVRTEFDVHNRRTAVLLELTPTGLGGVPVDTIATTGFEYDANRNLVGVTDARGRRTAYHYDALDRQRETVFPDSSRTAIEYDPDGNVIATQDSNGVRRNFTVDAVGQTIRVDIDISSLSPGASVEGATFEQYRYDGLGRVVSAENDFSRIETTYNSLGWPLAETTTVVAPEAVVGVPLVLQRQFNDAGTLIGLTYPNGRRLTFIRDALDRLISIHNLANGVEYPGDLARPEVSEVARMEYAGRRRVRCRYGNATTIDYAYDAGGRLIEIAHASANGPMLAIQYLFDAVGNARLRQDIHPSGAASEAFGYDSLYRLVSAALSTPTPIDASALGPPGAPLPQVIPNRQADIDQLIGPLALPPAPRTYDYDLVGNRTSEELPAGGRIGYTFNEADQYIARDGEALGYDPSGNLRDSGRVRCLYDSLHRLVRSVELTGDQQTSRFLHDVLGRRVLDIGGGAATQFVWDGSDLIAEYRNGGVSAMYVHDDPVDRPLQIAVGGGEHWYHADLVGSVRLLTDSSGMQSAAYRYSAFGATVDETSNGAFNPLRYTGRWLDRDGTYDFRARQYDPRLGRFLQRDPLGRVNGTNLYGYAMDNPMTLKDPFGTDARLETSDLLYGYVGLTPHIPILAELYEKYNAREKASLKATLESAGAKVPLGPPGPNDYVIDPGETLRDALLDKLTGGWLSRKHLLITKDLQEAFSKDAQETVRVVSGPRREHLDLFSDVNISAATKAAVTAWGTQQQRKGGLARVLGTVARMTGEHWEEGNLGLGLVRDFAIFGGLARWSRARTVGAASAAPGVSATLSESQHAMRVAAQLGFEPELGAGFYTGLAGSQGGPLSSAAGVSTYFNRLRLGGTFAETWGGRYLNALERQGLQLDRWVWEAGSSAYAWSVAEAGGRATLLRAGNLGNIWTRLEAPLLRTGNVPIRVHLRVFQPWE